MTTNTAVVLMMVIAKISLYDCAMGEAGHSQQRDDGAVVRQGIHAAGSHRGNAVEDLERNARRLRRSAMKVSDIAASAMLMPPEAEPVMPASDGNGNRFIDQRIREWRASASAMTRKPGNAAMTAPKPYSDAVFIDASKAPPTAALLPSANFSITVFPAKTKTVSDTDQQRPFDGPDRGDGLGSAGPPGATLPITAGMKDVDSP